MSSRLRPAVGQCGTLSAAVAEELLVWSWLIDPETQRSRSFSHLLNHPFFTRGKSLASLLFVEMPKRVIASLVIAS